MTEREYMPVSALWGPVIGTAVVVCIVWAVIMLIAAALVREERKKTNNTLRFRESLFRYIAGEAQEPDAAAADIGRYLTENRATVGDILERERLIRIKLKSEQRTLLRIQHPQQFPYEMLQMTEDERWHALSDDPAARGVLVKLLAGEITTVPNMPYESGPLLSMSSWIIAGSLLCQLIGFWFYLDYWARNWKWTEGYVKEKRYEWYELHWLARMSMALLLPGAAPMLVPMAAYAIGRSIRDQWNETALGVRRVGGNKSRVAADKDLLKKLQRRVEQRTGESDVRISSR